MPTKVTGTRTPEQVEKRKRKRNPLMRGTPAQIDAYVEANVHSLDDAKELMKEMLKMIKANMIEDV